jgi:hypothetical protein
VKLLPCPFCEGPPVLFRRDTVSREIVYRPFPPSDSGDLIEARIFCHECGAQSPRVDALIREDDELDALELAAVAAWNQRDARHRGMYDSGEARGLCEYPRTE